MFTDEGQITDKSKLPIQAWSYGPLRFQNEKMAVTIGSLRCDPKVSEREEKSLKMKVLEHGNTIIEIERESYDNLSTLKTLMNTKESTIRHDMVNLHNKTKVRSILVSYFIHMRLNINGFKFCLKIEKTKINSMKGLVSVFLHQKAH